MEWMGIASAVALLYLFTYRVSQKNYIIRKQITEPRLSYIILWEQFYMYRNVSLKMDKIFPKYYLAYFGLCKFFNNGICFLMMQFFRTPCMTCYFQSKINLRSQKNNDRHHTGQVIFQQKHYTPICLTTNFFLENLYSTVQQNNHI